MSKDIVIDDALWIEIDKVFSDLGIEYDRANGNPDEGRVAFHTKKNNLYVVRTFFYDKTAEDFINEVCDRAYNYDVDAETTMWANERGIRDIPTSVRQILEDCEEAKGIFMDLADKLKKLIM